MLAFSRAYPDAGPIVPQAVAQLTGPAKGPPPVAQLHGPDFSPLPVAKSNPSIVPQPAAQSSPGIVQPLVAHLPWAQNVLLMQKLKDLPTRLCRERAIPQEKRGWGMSNAPLRRR
jgi:hypothetical protein